jgi:Flp pilus assembly protein TadG
MKFRNEKGQSIVITVVFLTVLLGMAALVLDVGSWYRAHRAAQSTADASALAGAQALPRDMNEARTLANEYANKNGGGIAAGGIRFCDPPEGCVVPNDTINVTVSRQAPGFFAQIFGSKFKQVTVTGRASARAYGVERVKYVAPITVHYKHQYLNCSNGRTPVCNPDFGRTTTLNLEDLHKPGGGNGAGAFGLLNLNYGDPNGNIGADTLAKWLTEGYQEALPTGRYYSAPSANFNNSQFLGALDSVIGKEVLFPVYRLLTGPGSNAEYDIIGWIGFIVRSYNAQGSNGSLTGEFTRYIAEGIPADDGGGSTDLGVTIVELVQ